MRWYVAAIDQSTQGTKALLFDEKGGLVGRTDRPHRQIVNEKGWISHDLTEIYANTLQAVRDLVKETGIEREQIAGLGISNQRETSAVWDRITGEPLSYAVVWQCSRAADICRKIELEGFSERIRQKTGLPLSPYFPAAKLSWLLRHSREIREKAEKHELMAGTMDTWLVYRLTGGKVFCTDFSNASRSQLFDLRNLKWDEELCGIFEIPLESLPQVRDSDGEYGMTDLEGFLPKPVPIHGVLGDSHGALLAQGCMRPGMVKATYGTGSSVMLQTGDRPADGGAGLSSSIGWKVRGKLSYVLEGNINYTGAVVSWLQEKLGLITDPSETEFLARAADQEDKTYLVPAFTGLGAPYWDSNARASLWGMGRMTGREEIVKAALESIAYQIADVLGAMERQTGIVPDQIRADGGAAANRYLMQFQSSISRIPVWVSSLKELSGAGAAYAAGMGMGLYDERVLYAAEREEFLPGMEETERIRKWKGWREALRRTLD